MVIEQLFPPTDLARLDDLTVIGVSRVAWITGAP
jgi:hypothetical protein